MKNKSKVILLLLVAVAILSSVAISEKIDPITHNVLPEPDDVLYNRAPTPLPWIPEKLTTSDYWIGRMENPDEVIMSLDKIETMNTAYKKRISVDDPFANEPEIRKPKLIHWWPGFSFRNPDLSTFPRDAVADTVKARIQDGAEYLRKQEYGNCLAIKYSEAELDGFEKEMALDKVGDRITVRYGLTVRPSRLRNIPSFYPEQPGLIQSRKTRWDLWNIGVIKIGRPVQILHVSESGVYFFVLSDVGYGWVRSDNIAFGLKADILEFANDSDFVIATSGRAHYYADAKCSIASGWFGMGTRLPVISKTYPLVVKIPVRKMNGELDVETAFLPDNGEVNVGYLPYTRRNIIDVAFTLIGDPYDWSGAWFGRQHENTYSDIFACFGFVLPNHGALFTFFNDNNTKVLESGEGKDAIIKAVNANEPFVTLLSCAGHCMLYIGEYEGRPIFYDQHGYGYPDENDVWHEVRRNNIGDPRLPRYFFAKEITSLELR